MRSYSTSLLIKEIYILTTIPPQGRLIKCDNTKYFQDLQPLELELPDAGVEIETKPGDSALAF